MSKLKPCRCGKDAVDELLLTNKNGAELRIPFCEDHRGEVEKAVAMLHEKGVNEL